MQTTASSYSTSTALKSGTDEVRVEFAASLDATPAPIPVGQSSSAISERRVATKSPLDVERELEKLRRVALGNSPGVARRGGELRLPSLPSLSIARKKIAES